MTYIHNVFVTFFFLICYYFFLIFEFTLIYLLCCLYLRLREMTPTTIFIFLRTPTTILSKYRYIHLVCYTF